MRQIRSRIVPTFNRIAERYDEQYADDGRRMHAVVGEWATACVAAPATVLDIGCGTGSLLATAAQWWPDAQLLGIDPADRMIAVAAAKLPAAELKVGTAEQIPVASGSMDVVFSTNAFAQWQDQPAGLAEVRRVLRDGGRLFLAELDRPGLLTRLVYQVPDFRDAAQTRALVEAAGLSVERLELLPDRTVVTQACRV